MILVDVVLVEADADGPGVDLHEFGQKILEAPADADRCAQRGFEVRELFPGERAVGVGARARLVDDRVLEVQVVFLDDLGDEFFGGAASGAVADRDGLDAVASDRRQEGRLAFEPLFFRFVRIEDGFGEQPAIRLEDGDLAPAAEARLDDQDARIGERRRHQEAFEVGCENLDGVFLGLASQSAANLPLDGRQDKPAQRVAEHRL